MDPWASLALLSEIRALATASASSSATPSLLLDDTALWALLSIAEVTRALGGLASALSNSLKILPAAARNQGRSPMVTLEEARRAGLCGDCDVRYACLRMAVASPKTTTLPTEGEQALVEEVRVRVGFCAGQSPPWRSTPTHHVHTHTYTHKRQVLTVSLKAPLSGQRHGLVRAFRALFARYREALRIHGATAQGKGNMETETVLERAERAVAAVARILCEVREEGIDALHTCHVYMLKIHMPLTFLFSPSEPLSRHERQPGRRRPRAPGPPPLRPFHLRPHHERPPQLPPPGAEPIARLPGRGRLPPQPLPGTVGAHAAAGV